MAVQAEREIFMNNQHENVIVRGLIRPGDMGPNNTVLSSSLSNLEIEMKGKGIIADGVRPPNPSNPGDPMDIEFLKAFRRMRNSPGRSCSRYAARFAGLGNHAQGYAARHHPDRGGARQPTCWIRPGGRPPRTGDTQQTFFTVQTLANSLIRMGVQIAPGTVVVKNVAAVFVTANLPPFARPGHEASM